MSTREYYPESYSPPMPHMLADGSYNIDLAGEEEVPTGFGQVILVGYLISVLRHYYRMQNWSIVYDIPLYENPKVYIAPDVLLFKRLKRTTDDLFETNSWPVYLEGYTPPNVVMEVSSDSTWSTDVTIENKPSRYAKLNIEEYFAYDPHKPQIWRDKTTRLRGWRSANGLPQEITPTNDGWLWSEQLDSWLVPDGNFLRLYDFDGNLRLSEAEALARALADKERAWAKLRELGIDPETM